MQVLDIGCGTGGFLRFLINMGIPPNHLYGLDLMFNRIKIATQRSSKHSSFCVGNGNALPYPTSKFDLVSQFTVFSSILDCRMRRHVAGEMVRVLKVGGYVLWYDMRRTRSAHTKGIEIEEIESLFHNCALVLLRKIHPPRASSIARRSLFLADTYDRIMPFGKTHYLALLRKR